MQQRFAHVASGLIVSELLAAVSARSSLWGQITERQTIHGSPHRDTKAIFLRWARTLSVEAVFNEIPAFDFPALRELPEAQKLIDLVAGLVGSKEIGRAMIVSLAPGGLITPHADEGAYADHFERFHIVLQSDPGNWFYVGQPTINEQDFSAVQMEEGQVWSFNHKETHWVLNDSKTERIHLILDCVAPAFRKERVHALSA